MGIPTKQYSDFFNDFSAMLAQENVQVVENSLGGTWLEQGVEEFYEMEPWIALLERNVWTVDNNLNIMFNGQGVNNPIIAWSNTTNYALITPLVSPWTVVSYSGNYYVLTGAPTIGEIPSTSSNWAQIVWPSQGNNIIALWNSTSAFPQGMLVYYSTTGLYYQSLGSPTPANDLPTDTTNWQKVLIPTDTIRKLWTISENDPLNPSGGPTLNGSVYNSWGGTSYSVIFVEGQEIPGGVFLSARSPGDQLWVQYTPERSGSFVAPAWVSGNAYTAGQSVYYDPALNYYYAINNQASSTTTPNLDTTNWAPVTVPRELYPFIRDTAVANFLASLKNERYAFYQQRAEMFMLDRKMAMLRNPFSQPQQIVKTHATERRNPY